MVGTKNNRRTLYTLQAIKKAFLQLLETNELRKITVSQICRKADINRGTFYLHYENPLALFHQIENELLAEIRPLLASRPQEALAAWLKRLLLVLSQHETVSRIILKNYQAGTMISAVFSEVHDQVIDEFRATYTSDNKAILEYYFDYFVQGCVGVILTWFERKQNISIDELTQVLTNVIT